MYTADGDQEEAARNADAYYATFGGVDPRHQQQQQQQQQQQLRVHILPRRTVPAAAVAASPSAVGVHLVYPHAPPTTKHMTVVPMVGTSPMAPFEPLTTMHRTPSPAPIAFSQQPTPYALHQQQVQYEQAMAASGVYPSQVHARHPQVYQVATANSPVAMVHVQPAAHHQVQLHGEAADSSASSGSEGETDSPRIRKRILPRSTATSSPGRLVAIWTWIALVLHCCLPSRRAFSTAAANLRYAWRYYGPFRRKKNQPLHTAVLQPRALVLLFLLFALVYLLAFAYSCTSLFGCRFFPFFPRPKPANVPFTIISLLRDMSEETLLKDKSQFVIQWNALISWAMVVPASQILIYMDTEPSCRRIMSQPELVGMKCLVVPCWHAEHKRPLLDCIFRVAHEHAETEIIAYVNGDILLHSDVQLLVNQISAWFPDFLIVSRRTDTLVPQHVLDEFSSKSSQDQVTELLALSVTHGQLHSEFGIDLFAYPKSLFDELHFPPYLAGVYRWDNWLLSEMILRENVAVIDATRQGLVVHQEMGKVGHQGRTGAAYNDAIAKARSGMKYKIGNIQNTDYILQYESATAAAPSAFSITAPFEHTHGGGRAGGGDGLILDNSILKPQSDSLQFRLVVNHNASIEVLIAKRVNAHGWLAILPVSHYDLAHGHLSNWLCWADRIGFRSFIFLAEDRASGRELHRRGVPVLQFDEALEQATEDATMHATPSSSWSSDRGSGKTSVDTFDFLMFRLEFLSIVLRAGFHFLYAHTNTVWLEDPLRYLDMGKVSPYGFKSYEEIQTEFGRRYADYDSSPAAPPSPVLGASANSSQLLGKNHGEYDIATTGNLTHADGHFFAVRSTQWGKYVWKQLYVCEEANGALLYQATLAAARESAEMPAPPVEVVDCLNQVLHKFHSKLTRHILPALLFPSHADYFQAQTSYLHGVLPIVVQDDAPIDLLAGLELPDVGNAGVTDKEESLTGGGQSVGAEEEEDAWEAAADDAWQSETGLGDSQAGYAARVHAYKASQIDRWKQWRLLAIALPPAVTDSGLPFSELLSSTAPSTAGSASSSSPSSRRPPFDPPCLHLEPAGVRQDVNTPPISFAAWDAHHASIAAGGIGDPSLLAFQFKIRILTFDRPRSLARLLDSLAQIEFSSDDRILLEISIDYPSDMTDEEAVHNWRLTHTICDSFTWRHGAYSVIHQQQNIGLTGQWTWGWNAPEFDKKEIVLFMEDDMTLVPTSWRWIKAIVHQYYLNPYQYDPAMYGFSLQSQHTILGESKQFRYGTRIPHGLLNPDQYYYRYQLLGTWGTVFFPHHWSSFTAWLKSRHFQHTQGTSASGFRPCVPTLLSNAWWQAKPKRVWSQWMVRFAFERGWYSLYTNFRNQSSLVVNYREGGLNFKEAKGPMNPPVEQLDPEYMRLPNLRDLPLYDFHFRDWRHQPNHLKYHAAVMGASMPGVEPPQMDGTLQDDCYVLSQLKANLAKKAESAGVHQAEQAALAKKYAAALDYQRRLANQADSLAVLRQEVAAATSSVHRAALLQKQAALASARRSAEQKAREGKERKRRRQEEKAEKRKKKKEKIAREREAERRRELGQEEADEKERKAATKKSKPKG